MSTIAKPGSQAHGGRACCDRGLGEAGQRRDVAVAEGGALGRHEQLVGEGARPCLAHPLALERRPAAPSRRGTRARCRSTAGARPPARPGGAARAAARAGSRRAPGSVQDDGPGGSDRVGRDRRRRAVVAHEDLAVSPRAIGGSAPERDAAPARSRASVPGRVLGQEPGARLLQAAQRLVERRAEGAVDGHDLAGRLHLRAERAVGARELVEREARQLDDHVVERRLEGGDRRAGDGVGDLGQPPADGDLGGHAGDGVAGRLGGQRRRAADARVDLDDRVVATNRARARTGRCSRPRRRAPG